MAYKTYEAMRKGNQSANQEKEFPVICECRGIFEKNVGGKGYVINDHVPTKFAKGEHPILKCEIKTRANHKAE